MNITNEHKKIFGFLVGGVLLGSLLTSAIFISKKKTEAVDVSDAMGTPVVKVDGQVYTSTALPGDAAMEYYMLENNIYNARQNFANQVALRIALAKDAQKPIDSSSLPKLNEVLPIQPVTDAEVKQYYDNIIKQMGKDVFGGQTFAQVKPQLQARLNQQKSADIIGRKVQDLQMAGRFQFLLEKPNGPAVTLDVTPYAVRGNENASVTLVEVADYLCPHCREFEPIMESVYKTFKDKVKFVSVSFPLSASGLSSALARGAFCANKLDKNKFWKYHQLAFQVPWEKGQAPAGTSSPLTYFNSIAADTAKAAGFDLPKFNECLVSNASLDYVRNVQSYFNESKGFQGTPTFYLNNRLVQMSPNQIESTIRAALENKS